jgi:hypothetical protein
MVCRLVNLNQNAPRRLPGSRRRGQGKPSARLSHGAAGRFNEPRVPRLAFGDDLRASQAGGFPFLLPPAALGPQVAGWKRGGDGLQQLYNPARQLTLHAIEMAASRPRARSRKTEDLGRFDGRGHFQQLGRDWLGLGQMTDTRLIHCALHNAKDHGVRQLRLGAGTKQVCGVEFQGLGRRLMFRQEVPPISSPRAVSLNCA